VFAPAVDTDALTILAKKPNMRVVVPELVVSNEQARANHDADNDLELRSILGGVLVQARDYVGEAHDPWPTSELRVVTRRHPSEAEWQALRFAWRVCAHIKSNTILFAAADRTLAIGAGQMSRVDAVRTAIMKAAQVSPDLLRGSVAASDAFFPFRDGLDALAAAGATAVVQPGGSMRDQDVIAAADEHGLAMVFTGRRHFRH
jgi:phosphoribosylaminoimidazolecarboxamide formyltransferase/IMP cyclohydrolase